MTIGDVLAIIAAVMLVGTAWAAAILLIALAFPARVGMAEAALKASPGACLGRGLVILIVGGLLSIACFNAPAGPVKLFGGVILGGLGLVVALGSAASVRLLGTRIDALGSPMTPFASLTRASVLYALAGFMPVIGWFGILPAALLLSVGSGIVALFPTKTKARVATTALEPTVIEAAA